VLRRVFAGGSSDGTDGRPGRRFADNGNIVLVAVPNSRAFANRNCLSKEQIAALPLANYEPIATPQHAEVYTSLIHMSIVLVGCMSLLCINCGLVCTL
jgi:hypothetical protein